MVTIFLSGMCYAGKTTIGRLLAQRLNKYNIDSRDIFKIKYGISETEYLQQYGKDKFKEAEEKSQKIIENKVKEITTLKATGTKTKSGLIYQIITKGNGIKPVNGTKVLIHYAGYLENGNVFDTNYEEVAKLYGKLDQNRANNNGYEGYPTTIGNLPFIAGFNEAVELMSFGEKILLYIPSDLGYGPQGAGDAIPPNANIIFEIELLENNPTK